MQSVIEPGQDRGGLIEVGTVTMSPLPIACSARAPEPRRRRARARCTSPAMSSSGPVPSASSTAALDARSAVLALATRAAASSARRSRRRTRSRRPAARARVPRMPRRRGERAGAGARSPGARSHRRRPCGCRGAGRRLRHDDRIDEDGQLPKVGAAHGERHLAHLAGETQHRGVAGLVEQLPRRVQEVDEVGAEQRLPSVARPPLERAIDAGDHAIGCRLEVTAGCVLEELDERRRRPGSSRRLRLGFVRVPGRRTPRRRSSSEERPDLARPAHRARRGSGSDRWPRAARTGSWRSARARTDRRMRAR